MPFKEYFYLHSGAEENEYIFPLSSLHPTNADVQYLYSPQYMYILSSIVDSELIDSCTSALPYTLCDCCDNHTTRGKGKVHEHKEHEDMWLLNSGALAHFTSNFNAFIEYHPYAKPCHSQMANGLAPVLREGSILIYFNEKVVQLSPMIYMFSCT